MSTKTIDKIIDAIRFVLVVWYVAAIFYLILALMGVIH